MLVFPAFPAGDLIHLVNTAPQDSKPQEQFGAPNHVQVASKAYALSADLMRILMKSRVLNEEPLELVGSNITATGKRSDPLGLLCYEDHPDCQFSIPPAFNATFSDLTDVVQVMMRVDYNPFPFGYIPNYTVSSEVASMEFQSSNGTEIPVGSLDAEKAIRVMVMDPGAKNITVGTVVVEESSSVTVVVTMEDSNREAGLYFQVTFRVLNGRQAIGRLWALQVQHPQAQRALLPRNRSDCWSHLGGLFATPVAHHGFQHLQILVSVGVMEPTPPPMDSKGPQYSDVRVELFCTSTGFLITCKLHVASSFIFDNCLCAVLWCISDPRSGQTQELPVPEMVRRTLPPTCLVVLCPLPPLALKSWG